MYVYIYKYVCICTYAYIYDISVGKTIQTLRLINTSLTEQTAFTLKGDDSSPFEIEKGLEEIRIKVKLELDQEARSDQYLFIVVAETDGYSSASTATVTVIVTDINDNSPTFMDKRFTAQAPDPPAARLGRVNVTNPDFGSSGSIIFSLQDDFVPFSIDATSGVLSVEALLDAYNSEIPVVVIATDEGPEPRSAQGVVVIILVVVVAVLVVYVFSRRQRQKPKTRKTFRVMGTLTTVLLSENMFDMAVSFVSISWNHDRKDDDLYEDWVLKTTQQEQE